MKRKFLLYTLLAIKLNCKLIHNTSKYQHYQKLDTLITTGSGLGSPRPLLRQLSKLQPIPI